MRQHFRYSQMLQMQNLFSSVVKLEMPFVGNLGCFITAVVDKMKQFAYQ